jgi:hypothetical protein
MLSPLLSFERVVCASPSTADRRKICPGYVFVERNACWPIRETDPLKDWLSSAARAVVDKKETRNINVPRASRRNVRYCFVITVYFDHMVYGGGQIRSGFYQLAPCAMVKAQKHAYH